MSPLPNLPVALIPLGVLGLVGQQLATGRALRPGRGLGPKHIYESGREPVQFRRTRSAETAFAIWMLYVAATRDIPLS